jgi:hypothetical protein
MSAFSFFAVREHEVAAFDQQAVLIVGDPLPHSEWTLLAKLKGSGDGREVEVDVMAMPARFYRLRVAESAGFDGEHKPAFAMSTGSGREMCELIARMAYQISCGMLDADAAEAVPA